MTTMFRTSALVLLLATLAACGKNESTAPTAPTETASETKVESSVLAQGDLVPQRLFPIAADVANLAAEKIAVSFGATPKDVVQWTLAPEAKISRAALVNVLAGAPAGNIGLAIDTSEGTTISIVPTETSDGKYDKTLLDVAVFEPTGRMRLDQRVEKAADAVASTSYKPLATIELQKEMSPGVFLLKVGPTASKIGLAVWANQPESKIALSIAPSTTQAFQGEKATAKITLSNDGAPILGAALEGTVVGPDLASTKVTFTDVGGGAYEANVSDAIGASGKTGFYDVKVRARGVSNGVKFDRFGQTSLQWVVPTARIVSVAAPRTVTNTAGLIEAFELDVKVESAAKDRLEINGTLAVQTPDGKDRPLVLAQTADTTEAGVHVLTLRFDAGYLGLAKLEGGVVLRGLSLYSQGHKATMQRHVRGLEVRLPAIVLSKLVPAKVTPAVDEMIQNGAFDLAK